MDVQSGTCPAAGEQCDPASSGALHNSDILDTPRTPADMDAQEPLLPSQGRVQRIMSSPLPSATYPAGYTPRKLSELFIPPSVEELSRKASAVSARRDSQQDLTTPLLPPSQREEKKQRGSDVIRVIKPCPLSKHEETTDSSENESETESKKTDGHGPCSLCSYDESICSSRSAYFKHYYLKDTSDIAKEESRLKFLQASSFNSLASLIKEKTKMADKSDQEKKKKRRDHIRLTVLVTFLFIALVVSITLIHYYYHLRLMQVTIFEHIKFREDRRVLELYDCNRANAMVIQMGKSFGNSQRVADCTHYMHYMHELKKEKERIQSPNKTDLQMLADFLRGRHNINVFNFDEDTVCFDWVNQARLQLHRAPSVAGVECYNVYWDALNSHTTLKDCVAIKDSSSGVWWGLGELSSGGYPLGEIKKLNMTPYITGDLVNNAFGKLVRHSLLSNKGGLILIPEHLPNSVSIEDDALCLSSSFTYGPVSMPSILNYTICSSPGLEVSLNYLYHLGRGLSVPLHTSTIAAKVLERVKNPVWIPHLSAESPILTQEGVLNYVETIMSTVKEEWGQVFLPLSWQNNLGDFTFDAERFPDPKLLSDILARKGFQLGLTVSPLVATGTDSFDEGTSEGYWMMQTGSGMAALLKSSQSTAAALIDFTNQHARTWFSNKISNLIALYGINHFHLATVDSSSLPEFHQFDSPLSNSDLLLKEYLKTFSKVMLPISIDGAIVPPPPPTFVVVGNEESDWKSLKSLIPRMLTLSLLGMPLVDAGIIGGMSQRSGHVPEKELYLRWMQAAVFLPAFQLSVLPTLYDQSTQDICFEYMQKRKELVIPRLNVAVSRALSEGKPLMVPLALAFPDDEIAAKVHDQWLIGEDLLVAPILEKGTRMRDVYIPAGLWENKLDGRIKRGPSWLLGMKVPLTKAPHFIRRFPG